MPPFASSDKPQGDPETRSARTGLDSQKLLLNGFRGMATSPAVLDGYLKFNAALKHGKLPTKTRTAIAQAVAQGNPCQSCLAADPKLFATVEFARQLADKKGLVSPTELAAAKSAGLTEGEIAEIVADVALNIFTNYFNHLSHTEPDLPKPPTPNPK